ncbi:MAG: phosphate ABC transporter substrate-binding protein PstS [Micrococcales bacterium]|nr:phosphate ABC transporter substrate-binding protein PstS [Micrococcales bacterium]MCL2668567.1 phosphate ABC transporter substrate-binding protein PstS [Micrococcales bacterium]
MKRTFAIAGALALALGLAACGSDDPTGSGTDDTSESSLSGTLDGGGASSQSKAQEAWMAGFQTEHTGTTINYSVSDSGAGRKGLLDGTFSYAGTDSALTTDEIASSSKVCSGGQAFDVPVYVSPIAVAFKVAGVDSLNLDAETVAKIFSGQITSWSDPAITADNEAVADKLTGSISVMYRSDDSGTTKNFTEYLSKAAPDVWTYEVSSTFPVSKDTFQGLNGTSAVVQGVDGGTGTIGYADASAIGKLGTVKVKVGDAFVGPTADAAVATLADSARNTEGRADNDIVFSINRTTAAAGAYPVILVSYLAVCDTYASADKADLVKAFVSYVVSEQGQSTAASAAGSAPISADLRAEILAAVETITVKG